MSSYRSFYKVIIFLDFISRIYYLKDLVVIKRTAGNNEEKDYRFIMRLEEREL